MASKSPKRSFTWVAAATAGCLLALLVGLFIYGRRAASTPIDDDGSDPVGALPPALIASGALTMYDELRLQEVHTMYQASYLDLIHQINRSEGTIDVNEARRLYDRYGQSVKKYIKVLKQIADTAKNSRLSCYSSMKAIILAIVYSDKKSGQKMAKYDPQILIKFGVMTSEPKCPSAGLFSLYTKDGRRFVRCTVHGTLKTR